MIAYGLVGGGGGVIVVKMLTLFPYTVFPLRFKAPPTLNSAPPPPTPISDLKYRLGFVPVSNIVEILYASFLSVFSV